MPDVQHPVNLADEVARLTAELEHERAEARRWKTVAYALAGRIRELAYLSERVVKGEADGDAAIALELLQRPVALTRG